MKCAVLGNGPSRSAYVPGNDYDLVIGCNIPWTKVDCTMIIDRPVILTWYKNKDLITCPVLFTRDTWMYTDEIKFRQHIQSNGLYLALEPTLQDHSSGHHAAARALRLGYKYIDLYGMDSWYDDTLETYTRGFVKDDPPLSKLPKWRQQWMNLMKQYPDATLNFIKE